MLTKLMFTLSMSKFDFKNRPTFIKLDMVVRNLSAPKIELDFSQYTGWIHIVKNKNFLDNNGHRCVEICLE